MASAVGHYSPSPTCAILQPMLINKARLLITVGGDFSQTPLLLTNIHPFLDWYYFYVSITLFQKGRFAFVPDTTTQPTNCTGYDHAMLNYAGNTSDICDAGDRVSYSDSTAFHRRALDWKMNVTWYCFHFGGTVDVCNNWQSCCNNEI